MKAFEITGKFGIAQVRARTVERAPLGAGQVRVRMRANSLNYRDLMMIEGQYNPRQPLPLVPLSDGAGEIVEVGPGVTERQVGDRVVGLFAQGWLDGDFNKDHQRHTLGGPLPGMLQEEAVLDQHGVFVPPAHLDDAQAATLPCAALTAYSALAVLGDVGPGQTVLCLGTGGVSMFALAFAKALGARVIVTSSADEKLERARALGADETINYKAEARWDKIARDMTDGVGVDHVVEVGGAGTINLSLSAVRPSGRVSLIGVLAGGDSQPNLTQALMKQVCVQGVFVGHRRGFAQMCQLIEAHQIVPQVSAHHPVDEVQDALGLMKRGGHFGKICLTW